MLESNDYVKLLNVFNYKSMSKSVGHFFGLKDSEYCDFIIRQLSGLHADELKVAIAEYLPSEIVRE